MQEVLGTDESDLKVMMLNPLMADQPAQCAIIRQKKKYELYVILPPTRNQPLKEVAWLSATPKKADKAGVGGGYTITLAQDQSRSSKAGSASAPLATLHMDKTAMDFTLADDYREYMHVHFVSSLRSSDSPGAVQVVLPAVDISTGKAAVVPAAAAEGSSTLQDRLRADDFDGKLEGLSAFKNREPEFNEKTQSFELDFRGRALQASEKNVQLVPRDGEALVGVLVGKVDDDRFNVDFDEPFSAMQAFGFALAAFENAAESKSSSSKRTSRASKVG